MGNARNWHVSGVQAELRHTTGSSTKYEYYYYDFRLISRLGLIVILICCFCRWCNLPFYICRSCYRGQAYCSGNCRISGRRRSRRKAQKKYRRSPKGKRSHCLAENRRRQRGKNSLQKNMDDHTSTPGMTGCKVAPPPYLISGFLIGEAGYCRFCGRPGVVVTKFPQRGYGPQRYESSFVPL